MILLLLTSHRADCFALCVDCLERHTDLSKFEHIFVMANALEPDHLRLARDFVDRHTNTVLVEFGPRGLKHTMRALDTILQRQPGSIVVKIDEDVFVMPGWLEGLLRTYTRNQRKGCGLVSALVPNNDVGQAMLHKALCERFPDYAQSNILHGRGTAGNGEYAVWVWNGLLEGRIKYDELRASLSVTRITSYLNINCILIDPELLDIALPFYPNYDEGTLNIFIAAPNTPFHGLVTPDSLAHHYSFGPQQSMVDAHVPLDAVRRCLLD